MARRRTTLMPPDAAPPLAAGGLRGGRTKSSDIISGFLGGQRSAPAQAALLKGGHMTLFRSEVLSSAEVQYAA